MSMMRPVCLDIYFSLLPLTQSTVNFSLIFTSNNSRVVRPRSSKLDLEKQNETLYLWTALNLSRGTLNYSCY